MKSWFKRLFRRPTAVQSQLALRQKPPDPQPIFYPPPYAAMNAAESAAVHRQIFEPALRNFGEAYQPGEPALDGPALYQRWKQTRRQVLDHCLALIAASPWQPQLVLRGSVLLPVWLGEAARMPGDLDWVFQPADVDSRSQQAQELLADLQTRLTSTPAPAGVSFDTANLRLAEIWTYERSEGRRLMLPWQAEHLPVNVVRIDIVFCEPLPAAPIEVTIPLSDGSTAQVWAASPELSLVWKLNWLANDCYPKGKDLYDATLLAENFPLPWELYSAHVRLEDHPTEVVQDFDKFLFDIDWDNFLLEYPHIQGTLMEWCQRLEAALRPTLREGGLDT